MTSNGLLSRWADAAYWLARYMERAESLARVIDVNETFSRDSRGLQDWRAVLDLYVDAERFDALGRSPETEEVVRFYTLDRENPGSILQIVRAARENARTLRPLLSTEMWTHLNTFHNALARKRPVDLDDDGLPAFCRWVKEEVQKHVGITEGTFHRDEAWMIHSIGRLLERADQTTRVIDVKYHLLLPAAVDVGSAVDVGQWNTLLRSLAAYHAFCRAGARETTPAAAAGFLLFDRHFPRSVYACVHEIDHLFGRLRGEFGFAPGDGAEAQLDALRELLERETIGSVIPAGLHEFIDHVQRELSALSEKFCRSFYPEVETAPA